MWIATQHGFYSMVRKNEGEFHVRARVKHDLENLLAITALRVEIHEWPTADYRYRLILRTSEAAAVLTAVFERLDYGNFKGRITSLPDQREKSTSYHRIWDEMSKHQP